MIFEWVRLIRKKEIQGEKQITTFASAKNSGIIILY